MASMQHDRHEWMLTDEEMVDVRQHMSPYASPYHTERAMCLAQARKIAKHLEAHVYVDIHALDTMCRFYREAAEGSE